MKTSKPPVPTVQRGYRPTGRDYGYTNARIRGMRSRLLRQSFFEELMVSTDIGGVISSLMQTEYGPDLETRLLHGHTAAQVDEALKDNMVRTFNRVLSFSNKEATSLVNTLLGRWDLFNVKTILRGKHMGLPEEEIIDSLITVGQLSKIDTDELARQGDVRSVVDVLGIWGLPFAVPLREVLPEYDESEDLSFLELALDRYYYDWAAKRLRGWRENKRIAHTFLQAQVDTMNLLTAIRLLSANLPEDEAVRFFVPGGDVVEEELFLELSAMSDVDEVFSRIKKTPYGKPLDRAAVAYMESGSVSVFERALEDYLFHLAFENSKADTLGIGLTISYLWTKANEITNLRIVVKGISVGMPESRMREELIIV
ncbi:MAG: ATP synthase A1 subunit C [Coriobacteriia bacterium]|nr:ATP synthase A1 subunit C [Coriobacteriia bacterium]